MLKVKSVFITFRLLLSVLLFMALFSVSSVFASWKFTKESVDSEGGIFDATINEFIYSPEEILPVVPGENHQDLMHEVLDNIKIGLNGSKDSLENAVNRYGVLYSFMNIQGGNLKHLFVTAASQRIEFVIQYINSDKYYLYTFEDDDLAAAGINVTEICVYRTTLEYVSGKWISTGAVIGHSVVRVLSGNRTINPDEWQPGKLSVF